MSASVPPSPASAPGETRWGRAFWLSALLLALGFIAWDTALNVRHITRISAPYGVAVLAPAIDPASATGYADGRRHLVYPGSSLDGTHWIIQTQQMLARGEGRVRHVVEDGAPGGRPVHWASPFRWWLGVCAHLDHWLTGQPLGLAAERAALYANPALLALLVVGLASWMARRFGALAAGVTALVMVGTPPFYILFAAENPDHHSLIEACVMVCVVGLIAGGGGWMRTEPTPRTGTARWLPTPNQSRRAFTLSALAGGLGLWVSMVTLIPVFVGIGVGALWSAWVGRRAPEVMRYDPSLWRRWGAVGGSVSFAAYLLEYFPNNLGWRLEVNHPVYALAWLGAGEVLTHLTSALSRGRLLPASAGWRRISVGLVLVMIPGVVLILGGLQFFSAAAPFLLALVHDYVPECQGLATSVAKAGLNFSTFAECLPMVALLLVPGWLARASTPAPTRALAAIPLATTTLIWLLSLKELRWWNVGFGVFFVVITLMAAEWSAAGSRWQRVLCPALILGFFAPGWVESIRGAADRDLVKADDILGLVERDLAHTLQQRAGHGPLVVLGGPATTSRLIYFGRARGVGTAYWENLDGLQRSAAIFAARSPEEARLQILAAGITHIVWLSWDDFVAPYIRLDRGLQPGEPITGYAFGLELLSQAEPPPWLRPLRDHLPDHPALQGQHVRIFEVTDRTRPEEVLVRRVNDLLYRDQTAAAATFRHELERQTESLAAQVALARLQGLLNDSDGYAATMQRIEPLLAQATTLEPDARVDLVTLYLLSGLDDEARLRLSEILPAFDAASLRQLSPGALMNLLALTAKLGLPWPDPGLRELAVQLVPPDGRR